jgi:DNA-binding response OmpR family regulator
MSDNKKILIVDDEHDVSTWLAVLFSENGYQTVTAASGSEGMQKVASEKPDLITLDISMEDESGVKMYRKLQEAKDTASIPVIIITGVSPDFERFISSRKLVKPPSAFFEKPVDKDKLLEKVRDLIGVKRTV